MAILDDLIQQISDEELRNRISKEVGKLTSKKKFGLVYEEHIPECTPLYDVKIKRGACIAPKDGKINDIYTVKSIKDKVVKAVHRVSGEDVEFDENDVVTVAQFGEPIYPYLKPIDVVKNDPDGELWHTLIEADNYHALQLLAYLYPNKVDCIYIDPPYNTRAKDWKYNNDYVDPSDAYRHSKWLSMMEKRLRLAKRLLNPNDSVLIITIDEKEYLHLGLLLEEIFAEARIQMVTSIINRKGVSRKGNKSEATDKEITQFSRVAEFIYFVMLGDASIKKSSHNMLDYQENEDIDPEVGTKVDWLSMLRRGSASHRADKPKHFYPIFVDHDTATIIDVGNPLDLSTDRNTITADPGIDIVWPMRTDGSEGRWQLKKDSFVSALKNGTAKLGSYNKKQNRWAINYLNQGTKDDIAKGGIVVEGKDEKGALLLRRVSEKLVEPKSVWNQTSHNASEYGTSLLNSIIGSERFNYPKSLYAVKDTLDMYVHNKPNALIIDFFAGSGTTLHALNLLNAEDNGSRRCIMVTNNEVSATESEHLLATGFKPGDKEWESLGIARYVTWPRTVLSITGMNIKGSPLEGTYGTYHEGYVEIDNNLFDENGKPYKGKLFIHKEKVPDNLNLERFKKSDGFKTNATFFKLGFLDKNNVSLGRQFREMLPLLWMKAGAHHECPSLKQGAIPDILIYPENRFAVLVEEKAYLEFEKEVNSHPEIETVFIITDSQASYRSMIKGLNVEATYQLYRDYLDNFRINTGASRK